ncbi:MAG: TIGR02757 family protein [Chitinophagaceae bacterium]|nr:TIGR02757 family protein [Chitinophagaceae bacterium]
MKFSSLRKLLDEKAAFFNRPEFIENDPIATPHRFTKKQDLEIAGFFSAVMAWGRRTTIIRKAEELMQLMDDAPYAFVTGHQEKDRKRFFHFRHRTFQPADVIYFLEFLQYHYRLHDSLETAFTRWMNKDDRTVENALNGFKAYFFSLPHEKRTEKHISSPAEGSACKRLNMFLRWMVRKDECGVDFGIWKNIKPAQLVCPLDIHVSRTARLLGIIRRKQTDWQAALELTEFLRKLDCRDPVKYDFALFGLGIENKVNKLFT